MESVSVFKDTFRKLYENEIKTSAYKVRRYDCKDKILYVSVDEISLSTGNEVSLKDWPESAIRAGLIREDCIETYRKLIEKIQDGAKQEEADIWFRYVDDSGFWCEHITYINIFSNDNQIVDTICIGENITEKINNRIYRNALEMAVKSSHILIGEYRFSDDSYKAYSENTGFYKAGDVVKNATKEFFKKGLVLKDSKSTYKKIQKEMINGAPYVQGDLHLKNDFGDEIWYDTRVTRVFSLEGEPMQIIVCGIDITESKKLEAAYTREMNYQQSELQDRYLVKARINITQDLVESYNENRLAAISRCGRTYSEDVKKIYKMALTKEMRNELKKFYDKNEIIRRFGLGERQWNLDYQRKLNDKSRVWVRANIRVGHDPETGDIIAFIYLENIDEQKNKERGLELLAASNYDYVGILDTIADTCTTLLCTVDYSVPMEKFYHYSQEAGKIANRAKERFASEEDYVKARDWVCVDNIKKNLEIEDKYTFYVSVIPEGANEVTRYKMGYTYFDREKTKILIYRSNVTERAV